MPTYNRPRYAERAIKFWGSTNINLIVLDGSKDPMPTSLINFLPTNITYQHLQLGWTERILLGAKQSNTPFTALVSDDEFYLPNSIAECLNELEANSELISVIGHVIRFTLTSNELYFRRDYKNFADADVCEVNPIERVTNHLLPYRMTSLWAIIRTDAFIKNALVAHECSRLPNASSFELGFEIANSYQGKSRVLPVLHWMRSSENPPNWNTETISTHRWWPTGKLSDDFIKIATEVEQILTGRRISKIEPITDSILYLGIDSYCKNELKKSSSTKRRIRIWVRKLIGLLFKDYQIYKVKNLFAKLINLKILEVQWTNLPSVLETLEVDGIKFSEDAISLTLKAIGK
jgi:glycosyltransferase domain-containing protein